MYCQGWVNCVIRHQCGVLVRVLFGGLWCDDVVSFVVECGCEAYVYGFMPYCMVQWMVHVWCLVSLWCHV